MAYSDNTPKPVDVQARLLELLPSTWQLELKRADSPTGPGAILELRPPGGSSVPILVEIKKRLDPVAVPRVLERAQGWPSSSPASRPGAPVLVVAPYLSERTRDRLRDTGLNYLDLTGNTLLTLDEPALYIRTAGATKAPTRSARSARSLRGVKSARIIRALVDRRPPMGVRQIAEYAATDPGNVSRLLALLEREALVERTPTGGVQQVDWAELLRAWARDYSMTGSNAYETYLDPRGLKNFLSNLESLPGDMRYAVTGSLAAARIAPVAPARLGVAYVDDAKGTAAALGLVPADTGANVMLLEPRGDFVFEGVKKDLGITYVTPSQAVVDLLTGSGRNPAEAEELLDWMRRNEDAWRTKW